MTSVFPDGDESDDDVGGIEELEHRMWRDRQRLRRLKEQHGGKEAAPRPRQSQEQARRKKMSRRGWRRPDPRPAAARRAARRPDLRPAAARRAAGRPDPRRPDPAAAEARGGPRPLVARRTAAAARQAAGSTGPVMGSAGLSPFLFFFI